jgi:hypothetical protein
MARRGGGGIIAAVVLAGLGLVVASVAFLGSERRRLDPPIVSVYEDQACEGPEWAIVIRDGVHRACLSLEDAREILRRDAPFEYRCTAPVEPAPTPAPEPPQPRPGAVDGPVAAVRGAERL